jgi:hypothetical protein
LQAIHSGVNCKQYQEGTTAENDTGTIRTREMLQVETHLTAWLSMRDGKMPEMI